MICRRCGAEIPDNSMRCSNCGIKVNMYCPACRTLNAFGETHCVNCGTELLVSCNVCGSTNIYYVDNCRKCNSPLVKGGKEPPKQTKDIQVVESFTAEESAYASKTVTPPITVTHDLENNGLPVIGEAKSGYEQEDIENVFGLEAEFEQAKAKIQIEPDPEILKDNVVDETITEETPASTEENLIEEAEDYGNVLLSEDDFIEELTAEEELKETIEIEQQEEPVEENIQTEEQEETIEIHDQEVSEEIDIQQQENIETENEQVEIHQEEVVDEIEELQEQEPVEELKEETVEVQEEQKKQEYYRPNIEDVTSIEDRGLERAEIHPKAVSAITGLIKNSLKKHIIAVNGVEGSGKSAVLKQVSEALADKGYLSLYGSCTPLVQITSFGFFQDAFLRIMGFPPYATSTESFIKDFRKSKFAKVFSFLKGSDLTLFLNIFYPSQKDTFDNILENKMKIFSILEKIIKSFLLNNNLIILIDNFELLDGASYDFIVHMMKNGYFNSRLKLLVAYKDNKTIQSYFDLSPEQEKMFETVEINKFNRQELLDAVERSTFIRLEDVLDKNTLEDILNKADGNAIRMEQEAAYLFDTGYLQIKGNELIVTEEYKPSSKYSTFEELIKQRINTLPPSAKNVLFMAAIMGYRFATSILCLAVTMPVEKAEGVLDFLIKNLFVQHVDNYTCEFKSLTLWKLIYQEAKADLLYKENAKRLYVSLKPLILSSNLQKLISCTEALSENEEFLIWQNTASITAKLGDTNLYVIALKQCLKLVEKQDLANVEDTKHRIYEEMGKLLCEKSPQESVTYLANVLDTYIKAADVRKIIDISSYFVKSCYLTGNYFGAAEAVDAVLNAVNTESNGVSPLEIALIKTRKLGALLNIGNCEQIINLVEEEILPEINKNLEANQFEPDYKGIVLNAWFTSKIILAKAYAMQGNTKVNEVIESIYTGIDQYNYNSAHYKVHTGIIEAFAKTIEGNIHQSNEILNNISIAYKTRTMEQGLLAWWNLVNIINRLLLNQQKDLKVDLFELAAFANNINEHFIKNIIKLILGYVLKNEGNPEKAEEIYNEQIVYFAKEKVAVGALLTWALIVQKYIEEGEAEKALNTAAKSLEIAQSPKINNYFFIIYFQKFLAEIYLARNDFAATKMYLEKSIVMAKQFNLKYQLIELYVGYAKYVEAVMKQKRIYSSENVGIVHDSYKKATSIAKELALQNMIEFASREYSSFKTYCQLNSIDA